MMRRMVAGKGGLLLVLSAVAGTSCGGEEAPVVSACGTESASGAYELSSERIGCIGAQAGSNIFTIEGSAAPGGGYAQFQIDGAQGGRVQASLYAEGGDMPAAQYLAEQPGGTLGFYAALASGSSYRLEISDDGAASTPYSYRLTSSFTEVADVFEPNDDSANASRIELDTPVDAFLFGGLLAVDADTAPYDDYYRVGLRGGALVTVTLQNVPTDLAARVFIYDATGMELGRLASGHKGQALTMPLLTPVAEGEHVVRVGLWGESTGALGTALSAPDHFTRAYRLTVTQPSL